MAKQYPLARKDGLAMETVSDELLVYDLDRDKAYCLNGTAAVVWKHCDGRRSTAELARILSKEAGAPVEEKVVWYALEQLGRDRLLEEKVALPEALAGMTRRQHLRALGRVVAVAIPVVTAVMAPRAADAASVGCCGAACPGMKNCKNPKKGCPGTTCSGNGNCCSNNCIITAGHSKGVCG